MNRPISLEIIVQYTTVQYSTVQYNTVIFLTYLKLNVFLALLICWCKIQSLVCGLQEIIPSKKDNNAKCSEMQILVLCCSVSLCVNILKFPLPDGTHTISGGKFISISSSASWLSLLYSTLKPYVEWVKAGGLEVFLLQQLSWMVPMVPCTVLSLCLEWVYSLQEI